MNKQTLKEIETIKELMKQDSYFEYPVDKLNDNFINDSLTFLLNNNLSIVYEFGQMSNIFVVKDKDVNEFYFKHQYADESMSFIMNDEEESRSKDKAVKNNVVKFKRWIKWKILNIQCHQISLIKIYNGNQKKI